MRGRGKRVALGVAAVGSLVLVATGATLLIFPFELSYEVSDLQQIIRDYYSAEHVGSDVERSRQVDEDLTEFPSLALGAEPAQVQLHISQNRLIANTTMDYHFRIWEILRVLRTPAGDP